MKFTEQDKSVIETMTPEMLAMMANMIEQGIVDMVDPEFIEQAKFNLKFITSIAFNKIAQNMINDGRIVVKTPSILN